MTCEPCYTNCYECINGTFCSQCSVSYFLISAGATGINQCVNVCPLGYFEFIDSINTLARSCMPCSSNCNSCTNTTYCETCTSHYFRFSAQDPSAVTEMSCVDSCPTGYANSTVISGSGTCSLCGTNCVACVDSLNCT